MASPKLFSFTAKAVAYLLLLTITIAFPTAARVLEEQPELPISPSGTSNSVQQPAAGVAPVANPAVGQPNTVGAAVAASAGAQPNPGSGAQPNPGAGTQPLPGAGAQPLPGAGAQPNPGAGTQPLPGAGALPVPGAGAQPNPGAGTQPLPGAGAQPLPGAGAQPNPGAGTQPLAGAGAQPNPGAGAQPIPGAGGATSGGVAHDDHPLSFFMHDILGGSNPSARAVTGIVTNPAVNGQVPFAKPNGAVLPVNNGVPLNNGNSGLINNNNIPFLTGLSGTTPTVIQNNGNNMFNGGVGLPVGNGGQYLDGSSLQKLMFGTMTVIDDELTEGHELGSGSVGKAQGFYVASSEDGTSQTMAFTAMFQSGSYADSLSFFGVHRTAVSESQLAIMGGTGKYVNAKGYATVKTIPATHQQATTDGAETLLEVTVYVTY